MPVESGSGASAPGIFPGVQSASATAALSRHRRPQTSAVSTHQLVERIDDLSEGCSAAWSEPEKPAAVAGRDVRYVSDSEHRAVGGDERERFGVHTLLKRLG